MKPEVDRLLAEITGLDQAATAERERHAEVMAANGGKRLEIARQIRELERVPDPEPEFDERGRLRRLVGVR